MTPQTKMLLTGCPKCHYIMQYFEPMLIVKIMRRLQPHSLRPVVDQILGQKWPQKTLSRPPAERTLQVRLFFGLKKRELKIPPKKRRTCRVLSAAGRDFSCVAIFRRGVGVEVKKVALTTRPMTNIRSFLNYGNDFRRSFFLPLNLVQKAIVRWLWVSKESCAEDW